MHTVSQRQPHLQDIGRPHVPVDDVVLMQGLQAMQHVRYHHAQTWQGDWVAGCAKRELSAPAAIAQAGWCNWLQESTWVLQARAIGQVPQHIIHMLKQLLVVIGEALPPDDLGDAIMVVGDAGVANPACHAQRRWCGWELMLTLLQHDGQHPQGAVDYLQPGRQSEHKPV